MSVSFGLGILTGQAPTGATAVAGEYGAMLELAAAAEDAGFDSVWVSEHHFAADSYLPSILPVLAAIAARTKRLRLGAAAVVAPFHHPLRLAEDAAVVDVLSGGRLELGLVNGWRRAEFAAFDFPMNERAERLEETVAILRAAFSGHRVKHQGRHFRFAGFQITPVPSAPIPLWIGGFVRVAAERAGRLADGYLASSAPAGDVAARFAEAERARPSSAVPLRLGVMLDVALDGTPGAVEGYRYKQATYRAWRSGAVSTAAWPMPPGQPDSLLIAGTPDTVRNRLAEYAGIAPSSDVTIIIRLHFPGMRAKDALAGVDRFAETVMDRMRQENAA